jgi:hypothetical protein
MDEIIRELDDKTRNPRRRRKANPYDEAAKAKKRQEAVDKLGDENNYMDLLKEVRLDNEFIYDKWMNYPERDREEHRQIGVDIENRYNVGELDAIESYELENQWLRDDMRRMDRLRADAEVDMDAIIRELDDKTRNPH